ncbi:MAG: tRNA lysidine(34) synthetase TilS [Streptosporangiaceae bacterium]
MGPDPAVAAVRHAVRGVLAAVDPGLVLVGCSGGADSLALAGALAFEVRKSGHRAGGITIDHGLQDGSALRADQVVQIMWGLGLDPSGAISVEVGSRGGPEAAARTARYCALDEHAARLGASAVLLGHTLSDQAETVLMRLARGSGARSLAGMPARAGLYRRPLLGLDRALVRRACLAMGLRPWDDPHNEDPSFARVRVRNLALPVLEEQLGPGIAEALARTAGMLRDDADALDSWADRVFTGPTMEISTLEELPRAVRTRVLRRAAIAAGSPPGTLAAVHVEAMDRLVTAWRGQRHTDLPGGVRAFRACGKLQVASAETQPAGDV